MLVYVPNALISISIKDINGVIFKWKINFIAIVEIKVKYYHSVCANFIKKNYIKKDKL
jgi:hypothetical protein